MIEKTCTKCGISKPISEFRKAKNCTYGVRGDCKSCCKLHEQANKEKYKPVRDAYRENNKEFLKNRSEYYSRNVHITRPLYRERNKERISLKSKEYQIKNKDHLRAKAKEYRIKNKERMRNRDREYLKNNPQFTAHKRMQKYIWNILHSKNIPNKPCPTSELVGYTGEDLINHFNKGEYTFNDYLSGGYHIDHIIPLSYFTKQITDINDTKSLKAIIRKANSLENLRIITINQNLEKYNKICIPLINKYKLHHLLT